MELFESFSSKRSVLAHENNTPFLNLTLKRGFLNFPSFSSFRIGSKGQKKNPEKLEILESLKTLIFFLSSSKRLDLNMTHK